MDEYISREAVVRYLKGYNEKELNKGGNFGMITSSVLDKAERAISEMPSADVQPVRHGRWVKSATQKHVEVTYECSECQHEAVGEYEKTPFCGRCGARMDGDSE